MMMNEPIDAHEFLRAGFAQSELNATMAATTLRRLEALDYEAFPSDHCDAGPRFRGRVEDARSTEAFLNSMWDRLLGLDLDRLAQLFQTSPDESFLTVMRHGSGYWLDWHNHLRARPAATFLLYLFTEEDPGTGGDLVLGELEPDLKSVRETARVSPVQGTCLLIGDMTHPLLQHKAERWSGRHENSWRYLISFGFAARNW